MLKDYFKVGSKQWTVRRRLVISINIVCGASIIFAGLGYFKVEPKTIIDGCFALLMAINLYYIAGVVADDIGRKRPVEDGYTKPDDHEADEDQPDRGPRPYHP